MIAADVALLPDLIAGENVPPLVLSDLHDPVAAYLQPGHLLPAAGRAASPGLPGARQSSTLAGPAGVGAGVHHLIDARRQAIRGVASQHQVGGLRWWPPTADPSWLDFVVEDVPDSLPAFRSDLESALGCRVAVYLADRIPPEAWGRLLVETVAL